MKASCFGMDIRVDPALGPDETWIVLGGPDLVVVDKWPTDVVRIVGIEQPSNLTQAIHVHQGRRLATMWRKDWKR